MSAARNNDVLNNPRLPSLPAVAVQVLELTSSPDIDLKHIADVIQNDQALAAKIIRTVNSSYFGLAKPCANINQAMVFLGLNSVKMLALGFSLVQCVNDDEWQVNFDYLEYWRRCIHSAAAAREIARVTGQWNHDEAFLAALLQDLGMIAFFRAYGDIYLQAIDLTDHDHCKLPAIELRALQSDHSEIGAALAERWRIPETIVQAIRHHHSADEAPLSARPLARIIELATDAAAITSGRDIPGVMQRIKQRSQNWFELNETQVETMLRTMIDKASELASLFNVELGRQANIDELLAEAEDKQIRRHLDMERQLVQAAAEATELNLKRA